MAEETDLTREEIARKYIDLVARHSELLNRYQTVAAENEALKAQVERESDGR